MNLLWWDIVGRILVFRANKWDNELLACGRSHRKWLIQLDVEIKYVKKPDPICHQDELTMKPHVVG